MNHVLFRTPEKPSVWFEPSEVWEIKGAELTVSPVHQAAVGAIHSGKGLSLRFPRFVRVRPDKSPTDTTSPNEIIDLHLKQARQAREKKAHTTAI